MLPQTQNPYAYAGNNPINLADPSGEQWLQMGQAFIQGCIKVGSAIIRGGSSLIKGSPSTSVIPKVSDPKLNNIVQDLHKGVGSPNQIGSGSTADAIRNEISTGLPTEGVFHTQKGKEYVNALENWLKRNPAASEADKNAAQKLLDDLDNALQGK